MTEYMTLKRITDVAKGNYIRDKGTRQKFKVVGKSEQDGYLRLESVTGLGNGTRKVNHFKHIYEIVG